MSALSFTYTSPRVELKALDFGVWGEFLTENFAPFYQKNKVMARVLDIRSETPDTKTFVLKMNPSWKGFQPGQHLPVVVNLAGKRIIRTYSLSCSPTSPNPQITVKLQNGGLVSSFLHNSVKVGDLLEMGQAGGDFLLPPDTKPPVQLVYIAGGSGITPVYSHLASLAKVNPLAIVTLLYFARSPRDVIFRQELLELRAKMPNLNMAWVYSEKGSLASSSNTPPVLNPVSSILTSGKSKWEEKEGILTSELVEELAPEFSQAKVYLCGPLPMQEIAETIFSPEQLVTEKFFTGIRKKLNSSGSRGLGEKTITLLRSHRTVTIPGDSSILQELEAQGIYPPSGCRAGICHTCACSKKEGQVEHLQEGTQSGFGEETIRICVNRAETNLELEL